MSELQHTLARRAKAVKALTFLLAVMVTVTVTASLLILVIQSQRLADTTAILKSNSRLLVECTTPPAERKPPVPKPLADDCYVRAQAQTGRVVADIGTISIAAAACGAAHPGDVPSTEACVRSTMADR